MAARPRLDGSAVRHLAFFTDINAAHCDDIIARARPRRIPRGEPLFRQGEAASAVFMVLSGGFKATQVTADGRQVVMRVAGPGDLAGHVSAFTGKPYPATPIALSDSIVLAWPRPEFAALMSRYPTLALAVAGSMAKTIEEAQTRLRESSTERVERRIAHGILRLIRQAGHGTENGVEINFPITRQDIALMTGATLYTVSRILSAWEQKGFVEGGRQHLVLRDSGALRRIAESL